MVRDERQPCLVDLLLFASGRSSTAEPRGVRDSEEPAVTLRKLQESFHEMPSQPASCAMRPAFGRRQRSRRRLKATEQTAAAARRCQFLVLASARCARVPRFDGSELASSGEPESNAAARCRTNRERASEPRSGGRPAAGPAHSSPESRENPKHATNVSGIQEPDEQPAP